MSETDRDRALVRHSHVFLGAGHERGERKTWAVIWLCTAMMIAEIVGGLLFGSIALVADGLHMSTHAGALLLAALAYTFARKYAEDPRFAFGTGKLGDLAGFTSAVILAMIALLIGVEAVSRILQPTPIRFSEAIPIACLGLAVNVVSAWLLGGADHDHGEFQAHGHDHGARRVTDPDAPKAIATTSGALLLEVFEDGVPPRFRLRSKAGAPPAAAAIIVETVRPNGERQRFTMTDRGSYLESIEEVAEPHAFTALVRTSDWERAVVFEEHELAHGAAARDNNLRAAFVHVLADATVSVLVIAGLVLARAFGWLWMDPVAGLIGAGVIASWSFALTRNTGAILLDMTPDKGMAESLRRTIESDGDRLADLHLWRLGPGHLGAIVSVGTRQSRGLDYYRAKLSRFRSLSHLTIEVQRL